MKITKSQYRRIAMCFSPARGNVRLSNLAVLNAILYVLENGCKWRSLPKSYGPWHTIYTRMNRWAKSGVLDRAFEKLREENLLDLPEGTLSLDSTSIKVHPDGTGALKKPVPNLSESPEEEGQPKYIWLPRVTAR
jgi:Transposase and inactivated derivatives